MDDELMAFCTTCGAAGGGRRFCTECGASLVKEAETTTPLPAVLPVVQPVAQPPAQPAVEPLPDGPEPQAEFFGWAPPVPDEESRPGRSRAVVPLVVGLSVLLLAAAGVGGYLWWQAGEESEAARARDARQSQQKERDLSEREQELADQEQRLAAERAEAEAAAREQAETEEAEARAADPLALGIDMSHQYCSGQYLVILASSGTPADYTSTLQPALDQAGGEGSYLRTSDSCSSFVQEIDGNEVYAAYLGPFDTAHEACEARGRIGYGNSYVRELRSDQDRRSPCACEYLASELPVLSQGDGGPSEPADGLFVSDAQSLLYSAGLNPEREVTGTFGPSTDAWVREFQDDSAWLESDGVIGPDTWDALTGYCGVDPD